MQLPFQSKQVQERKNHRKIDFRDAASTAAFLAVFIGIWEVIFLLGVFPIVSLPSPLMVAQSLVDLIAEGTLIYSTAVTLLRLFVGFSTLYNYRCRSRIGHGEISTIRKDYEFICSGPSIVSEYCLGAICNIINRIE